jgi:hypothetical protein
MLGVTSGTTLIVFAVNEGVVMVADDLVYRLENGVAIPAESNVRKVFAMGSVLIGTAQLMRARQRCQISVDGVIRDTVSIEYKFEDWIVDFIRAQRSTPDHSPETIAESMDAKMRETFKPVDVLLEHGSWGDQSPGDRLVSYVVAGYSKGFKNFQLIELGAEYNSEGNGLRYLAPIRHDTKLPKDLFFGEDEHFLRALDGSEPEAGVQRREMSLLIGAAATLVPKAPKALQALTAYAVSLVKVEAEFNPNKIGKVVYAAILARAAKGHYLANF